MKLKELKQHIKELEIDYLIEGKLGQRVSSYVYSHEVECLVNRKARGKESIRLDRDEKIISTANGLLCTYILGLLSRLEAS